MELFLQILGGIVLSIILLIVFFIVFIRLKFGKVSQLDSANQSVPLIIHLNEDPIPDWLENKNARKFEQALHDLGFTDGKAYTVYEMEGYQLKSYFNSPYTAVVYNHEIAGNWLDIVAETTEGYEYTVSNTPMGEAINCRPETERHVIRNTDVSGLFAKIQERVGSQHCINADAGNFRIYFESIYKKDMSWKHRNGGISFEEFVNTARETNKKYSDKIIKEAFIETKENELNQWHEAALEEYKNQMELSDSDFEDIEYYLFIVPMKTDPSAFIGYLNEVEFVSYDNREKLLSIYENEENIPALFDKINDSLSPELRAKKCGEVDYPIAISIYKINSSMKDGYYGK